MGWYSEVSRDVSKIPDAVAFFEKELIDARFEVKLKGNVERAAATSKAYVLELLDDSRPVIVNAVALESHNNEGVVPVSSQKLMSPDDSIFKAGVSKLLT